MTNTKSTKRALLASVMALLLCFTMLLGTTFAWFTDSVTSTGNKIQAGTLDIDLFKVSLKSDWMNHLQTGDFFDREEITESSAPLFAEDILWEPGYTELVGLELVNNGSLSLKYQAVLRPTEDVGALAEVIDVYIGSAILNPGSDTRESFIANMTKLGTLKDVLSGGAIIEGIMKTGETDTQYFSIAMKMREEAGNDYQGKVLGAFDIMLVATQLDNEEDAFGSDYDEGLIPPDEDGLVLEEVNGIQYCYTEDGEYMLYLVTEGYAEQTVVVPEGVTAIGNYAFAYNSNVKEVILSSTVKKLGRGFDSSTVERVVLNEGLEQIDSRAFRSTTNLKEVVISSTVKTIADNAFQKSGITEIVIPATVETVGEAAFGASKIETVTFEGNTSIQGYAFRGCAALRTVYLNGDDVTFIPSTLNGRNSMWFCNGESNNPLTSNITFYVQNLTVASRVKTAMGAEANNTPVYVNGVIANIKIANNTTDLQNALKNAIEGEIICLKSGVTYDTVTLANPIADNVTVYGAQGAIVKGMACDLASFTPESNSLYGFTLQNVAFEGKGFYLTNVSNQAPWGFVENFTMDGCSFKGDNQDDVVGNRLFDYGTDSPGSHQFINLKITNCTVDTALQGIRVGALRGECEISGNVISDIAHNAITIRSVQQGTVLVKGNQMSNGSDRALRVGANSATINYVDNVIVNCGDEEGSNFKANTLGTVTFSGNTVDGEAWNPLA